MSGGYERQCRNGITTMNYSTCVIGIHMHAPKIRRIKLIARDMCIGDGPDNCAVRATSV